MRKAAWMIAALVAMLALAGGACKKKQTEQTPTTPPATPPTAPEKAAVPPPPPPTPAPPKTPETPPATPPAEAGKTDVKGNVKGTEVALTVAWARIEEGNQKITLTFLDKPVPQADFSCSSVDNLGEPYKYMSIEIPTGPKGDLYQGKAIPALVESYLGGEASNWSGQNFTALTITKLDLAAKVIEGSLLFDVPVGEDKGKLEGTFSATICASEGVAMELKPSVPELPTTPLTAKLGDTEWAFKTALARLVFGGEGSGELSWTIVFSTGTNTTCDSSTPYPDVASEENGLVVRVYRLPSGEFPVGYPIPADYFPASIDTATVPGAKDTDQTACSAGSSTTTPTLLITEIGEGEGAMLKGILATERPCRFTAAAEGVEDVSLPLIAGGTFEATICPGAQEQLELLKQDLAGGAAVETGGATQ